MPTNSILFLKQKLKKIPWHTVLLIFLVIIFFSFSIILTYDSGHYLSYVSIFEGTSPASSWDIVRGPIFPLIIHISNSLFGKTSTGILICTFLFYLTFTFICYIICKDISKNYKNSKFIQFIILVLLVLNPLVFGYFHVLLTEFVAITITILNILLAYKWIFIDYSRSKKKAVLYSLYFIAITIFCWHLKQPYIIIAIIPMITACIISFIRNRKKTNIIYKTIVILSSIIFLLVSIFVWNKILDRMQADKNTNRDSTSILSKQLVTTYKITDPNNTIFQEFFKNPGKIIGIYFNNYCSLSSLCKVASDDGVNYTSNGNLDPIYMYENTAIGYATYNRTENLFQMTEDMQNLASSYTTKMSHNIFSPIMKISSYPTSIIFKITILICPFTLIFLLIIKNKSKDKKYNSLFYLNIILLSTASCHLFFSAIALVIDRYAIEAFIPTLLGIFGTITYTKMIVNKQKSFNHKNKK